MRKKGNIYIKAGIGYMIGNILLKGINFITIPLFTRLLSTSDYGRYNTFNAYDSILFIFIGFAIHSSIKNAKYDYEDEYNKYLTNCVYLILINTFLALLIANIFISPLSRLLILNRFELLCLIICSASSAIMSIYTTKVSMALQYKKFLILAFFNSIANITLSYLFIYFMPENRYMGRILGTTVSSCLSTVIVLYVLVIKHHAYLNYKFFLYGLKISLPIIPHGISQIILSQFDRIMIQRIVNTSYAGIYSFTYNIAVIFQVLINSINSVWEPWFFDRMENKKYQEINKMGSLYIFGTSFICIFLMLIAPEIIMFLAPRSYWEGKKIVSIIILGTYFAALYILPAEVEYFFKKTKYIAVGTMGAAVLNIVLNLMFIPKYGYVAAAFITLGTYILYFAFHMIISYRIMNIWLYDMRLIVIVPIYTGIISAIATTFSNSIWIRLSCFIINMIICIIIIGKNKNYFSSIITVKQG
jgi:O-antigen/teichoic acid export membrane protein